MSEASRNTPQRLFQDEWGSQITFFPIPGSGNCFYATVLDQLRINGITAIHPTNGCELQLDSPDAEGLLRAALVDYAAHPIRLRAYDREMRMLLRGQGVTLELLEQNLESGVWNNVFGDVVCAVTHRLLHQSQVELHGQTRTLLHVEIYPFFTIYPRNSQWTYDCT